MFSDKSPSGLPQEQERSFPPMAPTAPRRHVSYALPAAVFLGLLSIALVLGYHQKVERDRSACYELMSAAKATFAGQASQVISYYLQDSLKPEWQESVTQIEDAYNLTFAHCRQVIGR